MLNLAENIGLPSELLLRLEKTDKNTVELLSEKCISKGFDVLKKEGDIMRLAVILNLAVQVKERYINLGIDEEIYYDTMSDIRIWCQHNGNKGLKNYRWLKNHVSFELFRIGRLQFQLYESKNRTLLYNKLPFKYGDKLIYIHIPEGEKLEKDKCIASIKQAGDFFNKYFSNHKYDYYFCESWLLFEGNKDFMTESSNIVSFMSLFDHCYSVRIDKQAIERIFAKRRLFKKSYPEKTSLQARAKSYMLHGNRLGIGVGVIKK